MRGLLAGVLLAVTLPALLTSCGVSKDTGMVMCEELCESTLTLTIADGRESFQLQVYGEDLPTINLSCPEGIVAGIDEVVCDPGVVTLKRVAMEFPDLLRVSFDGGDVQDLFPEFGEPLEVCSTTCNQASATVGVD